MICTTRLIMKVLLPHVADMLGSWLIDGAISSGKAQRRIAPGSSHMNSLYVVFVTLIGK